MHTPRFERALKALCISAFGLKDEHSVQIAGDVIFLSTKEGIRFAQELGTLSKRCIFFVVENLKKNMNYYIFPEILEDEINFVVVDAQKLRRYVSKEGFIGMCAMPFEELLQADVPFEYHTIKSKCASLS